MSAEPIPVEIKRTETLQIGLTMPLVAGWFCGLNDEQQADFFIEVARQAQEWPGGPGAGHHTIQWWQVGNHLRTCECSTEDARDMIRALASGMADR